MRSHLFAIAGLALAVSSAVSPAQTLLRDFNTTPSVEVASSSPRGFVPGPTGRVLFTAETPATGRELWSSDGTPGGTQLVADIWPGFRGSRMGPPVELSPGVWVFTATTFYEGWELWRTDGTAAGTVLVKDILPGKTGSVGVGLTRVGNRVVFFAQDGTHGIEPWVTDGTAAGTQMIADVVPGPGGMSNGTAQLAAIGGNRFVFSARINQTWEIWVSDLTAAGTFSIAQTAATNTWSPRYMTSVGNFAIFQARTQTIDQATWVSDGTASGTFSLGVRSEGAFQAAGNVAYFRGWDPATGFELWQTDGTLAGTGLVIDLLPGGGGASSSPWFLGSLQGDVLFFANSPNGRFLYRSDGTATGTTIVSNIAPTGLFFGSNWGNPLQGFLYFPLGSGPSTPGLYRTDGTAAGTTLVTDLEDTYAIGAIGSTLLLGGDDDSGIGNELWTSNGTPAGTQLLADLAPSPVSQSGWPRIVGTFRDHAVVTALDSQQPEELWLTDGTVAGTQPLVELVPGPGTPNVYGMAANERTMLLTAATASDGDPWFSDGTAAGTFQLDILPSTSGFAANRPATFGERFVFSGTLPNTGHEPWITDGTVAGTLALGDLNPGSLSSSPYGWLEYRDSMLFAATGPGGPAVWRTDGTPGGTTMLASLGTNGSFYPVEFGGLVYFAGSSNAGSSNNGIELWCTDGTVAGTFECLDIVPGPASSRPWSLVAVGNKLVMQVEINQQRQLIATDGTTAGTVVIRSDANDVTGPYELSANQAAFAVHPPFGGRDQLWRTDGTVAGTVLFGFVDTLNSPRNYKPGVDRLLLEFDDGFTGRELWSVDGTSAGTTLLTEVAPGDSNVFDLTRVGPNLVFVADDGVHGAELFAVPFADTRDWAVETFGTGCAGTGGITPAIGLDAPARGSAPQPLGVVLTDALPNSLALFGWSLERGETAVPGCSIWLAGAVAVAFTLTDASGRATVPIQLSPALVGLKVDAQFMVIDPAGPALGGASTSPALEFVVGH
ncbi:MAG: hypothetical protein NXI31_01600 [bacterium]|nr:hypothetical protein [bacterium]